MRRVALFAALPADAVKRYPRGGMRADEPLHTGGTNTAGLDDQPRRPVELPLPRP